jgi:DNA-binding CsgD family transcriptional regulator/GAF domain-containing protein
VLPGADTDGWTRLGSTPAARSLEARVREALDGAQRILDEDRVELVDAADAADALAVVCERIGTRLSGADDLTRGQVAQLAAVLVEAERARRELRDHVVDERVRAIAGVQAGLARLRGIGSVASMIEKAPLEVCRACGFDRAVLFRIRDGAMVAESAHDPSDPDRVKAVLAASRAEPAVMDHLLLESEMVRRRMPALVTDVRADERVYRAVVEASGTRSYVAAPIMPEGQVIGFLHADRFHPRRNCDEFDRDLIWTFAEGFGYAFERTVLVERMRTQRDQVRGMIAATDHLVQELCDAELAVARIEAPEVLATGPATAVLTGPPTQLDQLLTRREIEVITLMAAGETNAGIAAKLVISEGTVKSHVKHILRKLRAANRAEAVSRYLRISAVGS